MKLNLEKAYGEGGSLAEASLFRLGQIAFFAYISAPDAQRWHCPQHFYAALQAFHGDALEFQVLALPQGKIIRIPQSEISQKILEKSIYRDEVDYHPSQFLLINQQIKAILKVSQELSHLILDAPELFQDWKLAIFFKHLHGQRAFQTKRWLLEQAWFDEDEQINWLIVSETLSQAVGI